jgi:hypothetical protein
MKRKKQAVLLIHGIGEQRPMDTLRGFVKAVWEKDEKVHSKITKHGTWSIPDSISGNYELRCLTTSQNKNGVLTDFYEYYWAHLMEGNKISHVTAWLKRILFKAPWKLPKPLRGIWYFLFFSSLVILYLVFNDTLPVGAQITQTPSWYSTFFGLVLIPIIVTIFSDIIGDAARYLDPGPKNIKRRQEIRAKGVELLKKLHDSGKYDRIIVVGHSLGTFIAYDILTYAWQHFNNGIDITGASTKTKLPELYKMETLLAAWEKYKSDDLEEDEKKELLKTGLSIEKYKQKKLLKDWPTIEEGIEKAETYRILDILKSWNKIKKLFKKSDVNLNKIKELLNSDTYNKDLNVLKLENLKKLLKDWEQTINASEAEKDKKIGFIKNWKDYKKSRITENDESLVKIYQQYKSDISEDTKIQELDKIEILLESWRVIIRGTFKDKRTSKMFEDTKAKTDEKIQSLIRALQSYEEGASEDSDVKKIEKRVALFKAWQSKEKNDHVDNNPKKDEMEELLGDKYIQAFLEDIVSKKYRHLQYKVFEENINVREEQSKEYGNWLVSDLVTLGSPLTYSDLLLAESLEELRTKQEQRELPIVPPILEKKKITFDKKVKVNDNKRNVLFFHDAAMFGLTRWTNITFKPSLTIFGDIISGPLKPVLGYGVKDVETKTKILNGLISHTNYWSPEKKKNPGKDATEEEKKDFEVKHILQLREALDLLNKDDHSN